jgi:hypothetical protein
MGQYSWLIGTRNSADLCKINWAAMDTEILFKNKVLETCYTNCLTLAEVAKEFDDTKFMGYLDSTCIKALIEFNRHLIPYGSFPRLYYDYEGLNQVWALEFVPGQPYIHLLMFSYNNFITEESTTKEHYTTLMNSVPERAGWTCRVLE